MLEHYAFLVHEYPLSFLAEAFTVVPIGIGVISYRRFGIGMKFLLVLLFLNLFRDFISSYFAANKINNLYIYNTSAILECILIYLIFTKSILSKLTRRITLYVLVVYILIGISFWSKTRLSSEILSFSKVFNTFITLAYFNALLSEMRVANILTHSLFWLASGVIIQAAGTFFVYLFSKVIFAEESEMEIFVFYWNFSQTMHIVFCCFATAAFWVTRYDISA